MRFTVSSTALSSKLSALSRVINSNSSLPILGGFLLGVPKFEGIRIHAGRSISDRSLPTGRENTAKDTEGCILVGRNREGGKVLDSRKWLYELKRKIVEAKDRGETVWLTVE